MDDFHIELTVRDYECDMQGVVNNAVYLNYLEHARHAFLSSRGLDFARLTAEGVMLVVARADLRFRQSLRSGDAFRVMTRVSRASTVRLVFDQQIVHAETSALMLTAVITATAVNERGRPYLPSGLKDRLTG